MLLVNTVDQLRAQVHEWKHAGYKVGFVPTMGNLHAGHLALVDKARQLADRVIVSIFVNPTQFGPGEDFDRYPRTLQADSDLLIEHATDLLFNPSVETMYGSDNENIMLKVPADLNDMLCGLSRPGHFDGVATVVAKLFNQVQPDLAVFGEKDYQQLTVIRRLVNDLAFPVEIIAYPTLRESDGLAMSSRNNYLSAGERAIAADLHAALTELIKQVKTEPDLQEPHIKAHRDRLTKAGFKVEYVEIRRQSDLKLPESGDKFLVALIAAKLGQTRLIDNCLFELE